MAEGGSKAGTWLKYGCLGCLGVAAAIVLVGGSIVGLAWRQSQNLHPEETELSRDLGEAGPSSAGVSPESLAADMPGQAGGAGTPSAGRVILDLSAGEFRIRPAEAGEPMHVKGNFDPRYYTLEEAYEEGDDGAFTYRVSFRRTQSGGWLAALAEMMSGSRSRRVDVFLPRGVPMDLEMTVSKGGTEADLGGLSLRTADIDMSMGGAQIAFREPLAAPMDRLRIQGKMGGGAFVTLGNASPRELEVDFSMGGMNLDLRGAWKQDASVDVSAQMGGGSIRLPRDVHIEGIGSDFEIPQTSPEPGAPTLRFSIKARKKDVKFY